VFALIHVQVDIMSRVEIVPSAILLALNVVRDLMIVPNVLVDFICSLADVGRLVRLVITLILLQLHALNVIQLALIVLILLYAMSV
jgi:hypothetical protein